MSLDFEKVSSKELCEEFGASDELLRELRDNMQEWLYLQPHLPHDTSKERLEWIILGSKMSLEQAKQKLDMYYTIRRLVPELFANRDPRAKDLTSLHEVMQYVTLPKLTPQKYRTCILRPTINDASKFDPWVLHKYLFMVADIRMVDDRSLGDIFVYDFSMFTLNHLKFMTPTFLKKCEMVARKAYAVRLKEIHFVNAPPFIDHIVTLVKAVLKPKVVQRMHTHAISDVESLHRFIPKAILPKEYGGDYCTMEELSDMWRKKVDDWRDWFLEQNKILVEERLRPGPAVDADNLFGFSGSFRKLQVD